MTHTMSESAGESFRKLRTIKDKAEKALEGTDIPLIADQILRCGYHPYREGGGRALLEILVRRYREQPRKHRPYTPDYKLSDITQLADELGVDRQFEETKRFDV